MTILIGYLPAPEGEAALETAFAEAKLRNTDVVVLNSPRRGTTDSITQIQQEDAERILAQASEHGVTARVEQPAHEDDLVQTLNEWAEQEDADLIVIGLRKRSAIGKFILGSQAQRILLEADVPVLTVKA
ncbi:MULTISPECIES: universal stress protein [Brevibacterium]|uniref:Universal stress protein n=1 Tax=Brevibacterium luteolum TaxID=199591 RepID=A0A2N6PGZ7_9MICO|nr:MULTISPECIES: universal stress protein [Brevibacterium]MBM7530251.1 nucleotide-binding universal stress UspA family protein [Brevibacterium luteolum]MCT1656450.1 universal stress protein [Brevibacterium luteolum]MCT1828855.1 universal stress protein [Brevibacterium luteolum]MCT1873107.1 universal stress protein [Brevibacterium luteolum]MCT1889363.1 universal stress protein [Brevibacterium luteolum]